MTTKELNKIGVTIIDKIPPEILEPRLLPTTPKKPTAAQKKRQKIYYKYQGHCAYCGCKLELKEMQVDHIHAKYNGGGNELENLNPSCRSCNFYKGAGTLEIFRKNVERQIEIQRKAFSFRLAERFGMIHCTPKKVKFYFETIKANK